MQWDEFLEHPTVTGFDNQVEPGKYLFGLVLHDSLQALHNYLALVILAKREQLAEEVLERLAEWEVLVNTWVTKLNELGKYYYQENQFSRKPTWQELIIEVGMITSDSSTVVAEAKKLTAVSGGRALSDIIAMVIKYISDLNAISRDIQNQEYLRLWERAKKPQTKP